MLIPFVSSKPVRLTTSSQVGNKVLGCVVCSFRIAIGERRVNKCRKRCPCWSAIKPFHITFSRLSLLSWTINLGFLTEGKSCCYIHHTFLLGFPTGWSSTGHHQTQQAFSSTVAEEEVEDFCEGSFSHTHPLLCYLFCFTLFIFTCIILSKTQKN
jgi:hypothetical protein